MLVGSSALYRRFRTASKEPWISRFVLAIAAGIVLAAGMDSVGRYPKYAMVWATFCQKKHITVPILLEFMQQYCREKRVIDSLKDMFRMRRKK
jgi:hypothetical protein